MSPNNTPLRALVVEDVEDDLLLLQNELRRGGYLPQLTRVDTPEDLRDALQQHSWEIIFCDYSMPKMNGRQALDIVRELDKDVPLIFVSGSMGEDIAVEAMRAGAQDYIMKDNLKRLAPAVQRELEDARQRREKRTAEKRLDFLTNFDHLTGLPNRILFRKKLEISLQLAQGLGSQVAVICIDFDRFKNINDSLGYEAGDILLQEAARRLSACVGSDDIVARFNADEFFVLLPVLQSRDSVVAMLDEIRTVADKPYDVFGCKLYLNASLGITLYPDDAKDAEAMLRNADIATCRAKDKGGKGYCFYTPDMTVRLEELMVLEQAMRHALTNNEFVLHYQPQLDMSNGRLVGVEALVRWKHPDHGLMAPGMFIDIIEQSAFVHQFTRNILKLAIEQCRLWMDEGLTLCIAVNISPYNLMDPEFVTFLAAELAQHKVPAELIEIELTESATGIDMETTRKVFNQLHEVGVKLAIDDFGTGMSSLAYVKLLNVDNIKIDRSFITNIANDPRDEAVIKSMLVLCQYLNRKIVAEGVETEQQASILRELGCELAQGNYFGKAMSADKMTVLLKSSAISAQAKS